MLLNFYLIPQENKNHEFPIRVSITINHVRLMTSIGYSVSKQKWNEKKQCVKDGYENSKQVSSETINNRLDEIKALYKAYEDSNPEKITVEELRKVLTSKLTERPESKRTSICKYYDQFVLEESKAKQWSNGTIQTINAFRNHLANYCGRKSLSYFDDSGVSRFLNSLREGEQMREVSIQKNYKILRWFLNWCIRKGYMNADQKFKSQPTLNLTKHPVIFLTKEELLKLYNCKIPDNGTRIKLHTYDGKEYEKTVEDAEGWKKAKDLFCFCCFTSLRYSDMANVKRSDICDGILSVTTIKTNDKLEINLNSYAQAILDKYKDCNFPKNLALPVITNQVMNRYIKNVCEICEINKPVSEVFYEGGVRKEESHPKYEVIGTHAGRRTFICFALASGIPAPVVMKWTGHSDYKAMKPYIDVAEKVKAEQMAIFEESLKG